jgi:2-polyprenyl-3-methyl-5-hydroxy-6-metoxy-1,4-benzoquinol methylase
MTRTATAQKIHYEEDSRLYQEIFYKIKFPHMEEYFHKLLRLFMPQGRKVLDVNTCTADLAIYFSLRGYEVSALEPVEKLCGLARAKARSHDVNIPIAQSDILSYVSGDKFDAVTMKQSIHRVQEPTELIDIFKNIHGRLHQDGILIFDVPMRAEFEHGQAPFYAHETAVKIQKGSCVSHDDDTLETQWNITTKDYHIHMNHVVKLYTCDTLFAMLTQAGFSDAKFFDASLCMGYVRIPEARSNSSIIICVARNCAKIYERK